MRDSKGAAGSTIPTPDVTHRSLHVYTYRYTNI